jgi:hypothetical protein
MGKCPNWERIDDTEILPQCLLILSGWQWCRSRILFPCEEQGEDWDITSDLEVLCLAQRDEEQIILVSDVGNVNTTVMKRRQEEYWCKIWAPSVRHDYLVWRPRGEVRSDGGNRRRREVPVEWDIQRLHVSPDFLVESLDIIVFPDDAESVVAACTPYSYGMDLLKWGGVGDGAVKTDWENEWSSKACTDRSPRGLLEIIGSRRSEARQERRNVNKARERVR